MVIITGTIKLQSEDEVAKFRGALINRAIRSRKDEGNIDYSFAQNMEYPTEIRLIEKCETAESLHVHLQIPDPEFDTVVGTAQIERAVVTSHDVTAEQELMAR